MRLIFVGALLTVSIPESHESAAEKLHSWVQGLRMSIRNDCGGYGRTTMMNNHLKVYDMEGQLIEDKIIETVPDFEEALRVHFCIVH